MGGRGHYARIYSQSRAGQSGDAAINIEAVDEIFDGARVNYSVAI